MSQDARIGLEDFEHVREERLRRLLSLWLEKRGAGLMPERRAIDPVEFPWALPNVWLCDFDPERQTFRYRLAGEEVNAVYGRNLAGLELADFIPSGALATIRHRYLAVAEGRVVLHTSGSIYLLHERSYVGERLILPLADESGAVSHVMGATCYRIEPPEVGAERPGQESIATALIRGQAKHRA